MFLLLALNARALCVPLKTFCLAGRHSCCFSCSGKAGIFLAGFGLSPGHGKEGESLAEWRGSQDLSLLFQSQISEIIIKMNVWKVRGCEGGLGLYSACISLLHPLQEDTHSMNTLDCGWAWSSCGVEQTGLSARGCAHAAPLPSQREAALPSPESWSSVASQGLNHHFKTVLVYFKRKRRQNHTYRGIWSFFVGATGTWGL